MKNALLGGIAAIGLLAAGSALAADLPNRRAAPAPAYVPPAFTWTGFYLGVNAGYGFGDLSGGFDDGDGFIGGGQIGYNYQIGQFVAGVEADIQYADINGDGEGALAGASADVDYFGTVRARLGFGLDRALIYGTGGFAYGGSEVSFGGLSDEATHYGWTIGGGIEYAFTNNITAKAEYLYVDLQNEGFINDTVRVGPEFSVVRAGLNYKF